MPIIAFDAGHGLKTAGKQTPDGIKEWSLNDKVRDKATAMLKDYDVTIIHTDNNEGNTDESLSSRVKRYMEAGAESFVSFHHNAFTGKWNKATGVGVYIDKNATEADEKLAKLVYDRMVKYTGLKGRGVKRENFTVITQNSIPAILCEGGFMDGSEDYKVITSDEGQTAYARAVAEALIEFHGLKKKKQTATKPKKEESKKEESKKEESKKEESFKVKVSIANLNVRTGPGTNYSRTGRFTGKGVFTITETKKGQGSTKGWGRLKSGIGWISLDYATKI